MDKIELTLVITEVDERYPVGIHALIDIMSTFAGYQMRVDGSARLQVDGRTQLFLVHDSVLKERRHEV